MDHEHHHNHNPEKIDYTKEYFKFALVLLFILTLTALLVFNTENTFMNWMRGIMGYFFLVFSLFKLFNIKEFADAFSGYDIVAKQIRLYGYVYPFIELALGIFFITNFEPFLTNSITAVVMFVSLIGVLNSFRRKIKCACLGTVINLPLSNITVVEDLGMGLMALLSLLLITINY